MREHLSQFTPHFQSSKEDPLFSLKREAWEELNKRSITEDFQHVPIRTLFAEEIDSSLVRPRVEKTSLAPFILPGCEHSHIVFVNGAFSSELSNISALSKKVDILPLQKAMQSYGLFLQNRLLKEIKKEQDPFSLLNLALHAEGVFIYVRPKEIVKTPIQVIQWISSESQMSCLSPRLQIVINKGGEANILQTVAGDATYFLNLSLDIAIEENGNLSWQETSFLPESAWYFSSLRATLKKQANLSSFSFTNGSKSSRSRYAVTLAEEGAACKLKGLSVLDQERQGHVHVLMEHAAPSCFSRQHFKSILKEKSRSSFEGKIHVHPKAQKTESYQLTNHLLLDERAAAFAKPNLQIYADDVKASHGATIAKINEEELFYLQSRGLSHKESMKLLALAFSEQHIEEVYAPLKEEIQSTLHKWGESV